ncbi:MAG: hypothetical protein NTZ50_07015 [Chloroflexi bacterium]|nr:hypothetical protein [Chloroflexota bacterium]
MLFKYPSVTVSGLITAPAEVLFAIVSDVSRHPELAGSGEVEQVEWVTPAPHGVGAGFAARQNVGGMRYRTRSYVQVYDPPHQFVWLSGIGARRPPFGQLWGFDFKVIDARTTWTSNMMRVPIPLLRVPPFTWMADTGAMHEVTNMKPTLPRLAKMAGAQLLGDLRITLDWCAGDAPCSRVDPASFQTT